MNKRYIRLHWTTILKTIRSYWFILISPILRIVLQYIITGDAEGVLLSEVLAFGVIIFCAVLKWFTVRIYIKANSFTVKSGIFLKSHNKILISKLSSVYIKRNLFDLVFNSAVCYLGVEPQSKNIKAFKVNYRDIKGVIEVGDFDISVLKTKANKKRFFLIPTAFFCAFIVVLVIKVIVFGQFAYYDSVVIAFFGAAYFYCVYICNYNYLHSKIKLGNNVCFRGTTGFSIVDYRCSKNKVGIIKIHQTPADRRYQTCKIGFIGCGESAKGVRINNADICEVIKSINSNFGLQL